MRYTPAVAELEIVLEYAGPDVDDGAMSLDDLVPVLQGLAGAYGKVSGSHGLNVQHRLRLTAIKPGSAKLVLDVWDIVGRNAGQLQVVGALVAAALSILGIIIAVIQLKKHTKNEPYSTKLDGISGIDCGYQFPERSDYGEPVGVHGVQGKVDRW